MPEGEIFPPAQEALINYDFTDIATGTGFESFDLMALKDTTDKYALIPSEIATAGLAAGLNDATLLFDASPFRNQTSVAEDNTDFDTTTFNLPRTVKGTAYLRLSWQFTGTGPSTTTQFKCYLYRYDGSTETEIGTGFSSDRSLSADSYYHLNIQIECTETLIKKGDLLRLTVIIDCDAIGGSNLFNGYIFHPGDTSINLGPGSSKAGHSRSMIMIPFKVEA